MSRGNDLARRLMEGERGALARAIGVAENGGKDLGDLLRAVAPRTGRARVIGFTGAPGAGKSTLVSA
ncbi:MAG: methylmalonyl Co-A mutase-associated GTPase MeaB, partial [Alphaproteobacteria bacterium]|nr:methylmalonyl Co-A mutase-associated GTPase MeaB [Alphaproteobacteria bacterium]